MKKIKLITLMVGFFALFILGNITQPLVHADVKYKINNVNVDATVNENGSCLSNVLFIINLTV